MALWAVRPLTPNTSPITQSLLPHPASVRHSRGAALRTYLYAAVRNLSTKHFRRHGGDVAVEDVEGELLTVEREGPLARLLDAELSEEVRRAVAGLPPLQREVIALFEYEGLSLAEVAAVVGADTGTVKSRLQRAREGLRRALAHHFKSDGGVVPAKRVFK